MSTPEQLSAYEAQFNAIMAARNTTIQPVVEPTVDVAKAANEPITDVAAEVKFRQNEGDVAASVPQPDVNGEFATPLDGALFMALGYGIPQTPLNGKAPFLSQWQLKASTDPAQLKAWYEQYQCNFGSVAVPGSHFMFEADLPPTGTPIIRDRFKAQGGDFTSPLIIASSPGKGHRYYSSVPGIDNISQDAVKHKDFSIRASAEQCVSPGSVHPITQKQYRVAVHNGPLTPPTPQETAFWNSERKLDEKTNKPVKAFEHGEMIDEGSRNTALASVAGKLWRENKKVISTFSEEQLYQLLVEFNESRFTTPLPDSEVRSVAQSIANYVVKDETAKVCNISCETKEERAERAKEAGHLLQAWMQGEDGTTLEDEEVVAHLSLLSQIKYENMRTKVAKKLGWRPTVLDDARKKLSIKEETKLDGELVIVPEVEPWGEPVVLADVLAEVEETIGSYVHFQRPEDVTTVTLWIAQTHAAEYQSKFPYLGIRSAMSACGKTTLLEIVAELVRRPFISSSITAASIFRVMHQLQPTLMIDELDTFIKDNPEFVGIMNSGHSKKAGKVVRVLGDDLTLQYFITWGPKAYGMIGDAPDTFKSRSLTVFLERSLESDGLLPYDLENDPVLAAKLKVLARKLARFSKDNEAAIRGTKPDTANLINRNKDNWRPLLVFAELAGGPWTGKAHKAAGVEDLYEEWSDQQTFLQDVRNIFHTRNIDWMTPTDIQRDLKYQKTSGWDTWGNKMGGITVKGVGQFFSQFGIKSRWQWSPAEGKAVRAYHLEDMKNVFVRFLKGVPVEAADVFEAVEPNGRPVVVGGVTSGTPLTSQPGTQF